MKKGYLFVEDVLKKLFVYVLLKDLQQQYYIANFMHNLLRKCFYLYLSDKNISRMFWK